MYVPPPLRIALITHAKLNPQYTQFADDEWVVTYFEISASDFA